MNNLLLFLLAVGLGFVAAIPIGGSQIEMAKRVLSGHHWAAAMVILGQPLTAVQVCGVLVGLAAIAVVAARHIEPVGSQLE